MSDMCQATVTICQCGKNHAAMHYGNNILPQNIVHALYCPECSPGAEFEAENVLADNGWLIDYEIEGAKLFAPQMGVDAEQVTPEFIFDEGYCTWVGYTPTDQEDSFKEKEAIIELAKTDRARYFQAMKDWSVNRVKQLSEAGWRKAKLAAS